MWLWAAPAWAQESDDSGSSDAPTTEEEGSSEEEGDPVSKYRVKFDELAERTIGTASKPVAFNWRRTNVHLAGTGDFLFELNNFNSARLGGMVRVPTNGAIFEVAATYAHTWDTPSTRLLALTPYRQPARPNRLELDVGLAYPLAEGVVTAASRIFPSVQLVFNAYGSFRYIVYPAGWPGMRTGEVLKAILAPQLSEIELENLDDNRRAAMEVDPGRYGLMVGLGNDIYFEQGLFISPRMSVAVPVLAPATGTKLLFWGDFSLSIGVAL